MGLQNASVLPKLQHKTCYIRETKYEMLPNSTGQNPLPATSFSVSIGSFGFATLANKKPISPKMPLINYDLPSSEKKKPLKGCFGQRSFAYMAFNWHA
jgi:hypothetical protein